MQEEEVQPQVTLDQLQYFWMPSGVPCFIADRDTICDIVEDIGFNIYYLLANKKTVKTIQQPANNNKIGYTTTTQPVQVATYNSSLFKVVNNFVGRVIKPSDDELPTDFYVAEESCEYNMPELPYVLVEKMDQFFRLVYSQHGTESIVLLTYDTEKQGSDGWGVLVPDQVNTPAHCKYDADSIAAIKPENVMIVGSVHSHPEMSAYASGTDHADQADFDGLHITYGWQKSVNNGATQYHIELQMSGSSYTLKPEDVFENFYIQKEPDSEVVEWSTKVKKAHPPIAGGVSTSAPAQVPVPYNQFHQAQQPYQNSIQHTAAGEPTIGKRLLTKHWNDMVADLGGNAIVIVEADPQIAYASICPACDYDLDTQDFRAGYCACCDVPVVLNSHSIFQIASIYNRYCLERSLDPTQMVPYLYGENEKFEHFLMKLNIEQEIHDIHKYNYGIDDDEDVPLSLIESSDNYDYYHSLNDNDYDGTKTICCNTPMENYINNCNCLVPILYEDLAVFESAVENIELYDTNSSCIYCAHYYTPACPAYRYLLTQYVGNEYGFDLETQRNGIIPCTHYESMYADTLEKE